MIHTLVSTVGLGILGIDPITAIYMLSMALRKDKKFKIALFMFAFMGFSILIGAALAVIFGASAVDFLQSIMPEDDSIIWAILKLAISIVILVFVFNKLRKRKKEKIEKEKKVVEGSAFKYIAIGFIFALTSFTDPTYFAVILLGGEANNILIATLFIAIWFLVSQFMAVIVYLANQFNLLNKLTTLIEKLKTKKIDRVTNIIYTIFIIIALFLMIDSTFYLFNGKYLF